MTREAREKLGQVIAWHIDQRRKSDRMVADFCSAPISDVAAWKTGAIVPNGYQWTSLKKGIHRALNDHNDLYQRARREEDAEREAIKGAMRMRVNTNGPTNGANGHAKHNPPITTPLADKLRPIVEAPKLELVTERDAKPANEPPKEEPKMKTSTRSNKPPGAYTLEAQKERLDFARGLLLQRPHMSINGADGLVAAMRTRFGIGVNPGTLMKLKEQVQAELEAVRAPAPAKSSTPPASAAPTPVASDIEAAVQLVLSAIPSLATFRITVGDDGTASVDYTVREVRIVESTGSLRVSR